MNSKNLKADFAIDDGTATITYHRIEGSPYAYLYEVNHPMVFEPYYLVMRRKRDVYNVEMFPQPEHLGVWAFLYFTLDKAMEHFRRLDLFKEQ